MNVTHSHEVPQLVTKPEAMELLQVSLRTVDRYISEGRLAAVRLSSRTTRITRESLEAFIADSTSFTHGDIDAAGPSPIGAAAPSDSGAPEASPSAQQNAAPKAGSPDTLDGAA